MAVIGPHANATQALVGNYNGQICPTQGSSGNNDFSCVETPFQALAAANSNATSSTVMSLGCADVACEGDSGFAEAVALAEKSEVVVLLLGLDTSSVEKEGQDREAIGLPGLQDSLASQVLAVGKPTVVVLIHGGAVGIDFLANYRGGVNNSFGKGNKEGGIEGQEVGGKKGFGKKKKKKRNDDNNVNNANNNLAILTAFYPGPQGASAIASCLFGDFSPSGRLPYTMFGEDYVNEVGVLGEVLFGVLLDFFLLSVLLAMVRSTSMAVVICCTCST